MATYPGENDGIAPPDMTTEVGVFRALIGDMEFEAYDPPEAGHGNYQMFSDNDILGFLAAGKDNISRGVGYAYLALAGRAAIESKQVKDFDLTVDTTKRPTELRLIAQSWFDKASAEEAALLDAFEIAPLGDSCEPVPEAMIPRWGRHAVGGWEC